MPINFTAVDKQASYAVLEIIAISCKIIKLKWTLRAINNADASIVHHCRICVDKKELEHNVYSR